MRLNRHARASAAFVRELDALVKQLVLTANVVIQGGFGDTEFLGDFVQGGVVIALLVKYACSNSQRCLAFLFSLLLLARNSAFPYSHNATSPIGFKEAAGTDTGSRLHDGSLPYSSVAGIERGDSRRYASNRAAAAAASRIRRWMIACIGSTAAAKPAAELIDSIPRFQSPRS